MALTPGGGHLTRENFHYSKITSGVHSRSQRRGREAGHHHWQGTRAPQSRFRLRAADRVEKWSPAGCSDIGKSSPLNVPLSSRRADRSRACRDCTHVAGYLKFETLVARVGRPMRVEMAAGLLRRKPLLHTTRPGGHILVARRCTPANARPHSASKRYRRRCR